MPDAISESVRRCFASAALKLRGIVGARRTSGNKAGADAIGARSTVTCALGVVGAARAVALEGRALAVAATIQGCGLALPREARPVHVLTGKALRAARSRRTARCCARAGSLSLCDIAVGHAAALRCVGAVCVAIADTSNRRRSGTRFGTLRIRYTVVVAATAVDVRVT